MEIASYGNPYYIGRSYTAPITNTAGRLVGGGGSGRGGRSAAGGSDFATHNTLQNGAKMSSNGVHPLVHSQGHTSSNYSIQSSQPSSRSSDGTTQSTLFPPPPMPNGSGVGNGGEVTMSDNIMNTVADASSSLFQICVSLRQRLLGVPGFGDALLEVEEEAEEDTDPVTLLWRTFRRGTPLMMLYNALRPANPIILGPGVREDKRGKAATFKFLQACVNDLKFAQEDCFIVTDLYSDDTTGFVKVARVVNRVLDILVSRGLIADNQPTQSDFEQAEKGLKRTQRQHIIAELVTTERTYVQHLELLQAFKRLVEEKGIIPGDAVHDIFLNLNSLLDFQRRFLIRVEQTNALPEDEQNWGKLFVLYCEAFKVYEPYIANQRKCEKTVVAEYAKLKEAGGSVEMRQMVESPTALYGFLMKPFQRLSKYPLLLDDLYKKGDLDEARRDDLLIGKEAATSVLSRTDKAVDREQKHEAVQELKMRVEDWKGHRVEGFGDLLLYGTFTVLKSDNPSSGKDGERQYHVYLFETILLCCKDIDLSKPKNKYSNKQLVDKRGKPKLQLKGRIFMQNVTDLVSAAKPGSYTCQIFWKGDPSIEDFIIRFTTEEAMKKWASQIEVQRRKYRERGGGGSATSVGRNSDGSKMVGTSATQFTYMQNQGALENPYKNMEDEDGDEEDDAEDEVETLVASGQPSWVSSGMGGYKSEFSQSRNGSTSSLRSRSTTGESHGGPLTASTTNSSARGSSSTPRFPTGNMQQQMPPLTLRTQQLQQAAISPGERGGDSYFSPTASDSPVITSSRTSSSSGMYQFPRQPNGTTPVYEEPHHGGNHGTTRFTAPAMGGRPSINQTQTSAPNPYSSRPGQNGMPAQRGMHSAQQFPSQPRNRSASSPDIHNNANGPNGAQRQVPGTALRQQQQPPVPDVPPGPYFGGHVMGAVPRSQSNSPSLMMSGHRGPEPQQRGMSPQLMNMRERTYAQGGGRDGTGYGGASAGSNTSRTVTPVSSHSGRTGNAFGGVQTTPPLTTQPPTSALPTPPGQPQDPLLEPPTQLKVKVHCPSASQVLTLVVPLNISYQSLKDRIDAKLQRSTNLTLGGGTAGDRGSQVVKLKYLDEEDFVSIQSDEDVLTAFETWREQRGGGDGGEGVGGMGEIELFCQR